MDVLCQGPEGTTRPYWPLPPAPGTPPTPLHVSISAQFGGFNLFLNYAIGLPASWPVSQMDDLGLPPTAAYLAPMKGPWTWLTTGYV